MSKLDPEFKAKWCEALRSGDYTHAGGDGGAEGRGASVSEPAPMSEAELLAKLREYGSLFDSLLNRCEVWFDVPDIDALSLLTEWRDAAVRAERERIIKLGKEPCQYCQNYTGLPGGACENCMNTGLRYPTMYELSAALQERPSHE
jgi:hypothetical protein